MKRESYWEASKGWLHPAKVSLEKKKASSSDSRESGSSFNASSPYLKASSSEVHVLG